MAYTPTVWVNGVAPAIDATNLNHMETQYAQALADIPEDQAAGTPSERTLGTGAVQAAAGDHTHTLLEVSQAFDDEGAADQTGDFFSRSTNITSTYGATGRRRSTFTPASAKAAVVCAGTIHRTNARNGASSATFSDRIVVGGSQRKEITEAVADGDGTGAGSNHSVGSTAFTEIDGASASTNYDWEHKESANDGNITIQDFGNALIVTEVSI